MQVGTQIFLYKKKKRLKHKTNSITISNVGMLTDIYYINTEKIPKL